MEDYMDLDKYDENIEFNRDSISNWERRYEGQLNELQGDELEKFKTELALNMSLYLFFGMFLRVLTKPPSIFLSKFSGALATMSICF